MTNPLPELLAPVGDWERLHTALRFGADAVYLGGPMLQLRSDTAGFSLKELHRAAETVHAQGKRIYVTVNSYVRSEEIPSLGDYAKALADSGIDAVIVSDLGAIAVIKKAVPELELHVSTQANCCNYAAARVYHDMGAKRVVLAREMTLDEIAELRAKTPTTLELECFIHGAMCMAISGRCLLSAWMNGRSGNRGQCSQPCRYPYELREIGQGGGSYPVFEDEGGATILSSGDLNTMAFLDDILGAGVSSLKIEGRMKSAYYVATVVNAYRHRLDGTASVQACEAELLCASHREYTSGFFFGEAVHRKPDSGVYTQDCTFIAAVLQCLPGRLLIEQRNNFRKGDVLELLSPASVGLKCAVERMTDLDGNEVDYAPHPKQQLWLYTDLPARPGDFLRRRNDRKEF